MKRTIPLLITAIAGLLLIGQFFIPPMQMLGELAAIFFDILAAVAFILGGGNLLKVHLKKISDHGAGWAYSAITIVTFVITLYVGLAKWGAPPAPKQEHFGETFANLPLRSFEFVASVEGTIPTKKEEEHLPPSVRNQLSQGDEKGVKVISFTGWMHPNQKADLINYKDDLQWRCNVETLFKKAQPPEMFKGKIKYYEESHNLSFKGRMTEDEQKQLLPLMTNDSWKAAVITLFKNSRRTSKIYIDKLPAGLDTKAIEQINGNLAYDAAAKTLSIAGPMSTATRDTLARFPFAPAKPLSTEDRKQLIEEELNGRSPANKLTMAQVTALDRVLGSDWTVDQFRMAIDLAGQIKQVDKTACEKLAEMEAGVSDIRLKKPDRDERLSLNEKQVALLSLYVVSDWSADELVTRLTAAGPIHESQSAAVTDFLEKSPTAARRKRDIWQALLTAGDLNRQHEAFLLADYREQVQWRSDVGRLFVAAHVVKHSWSGEYRADGAPFWWLYEYAFKPLTATMFAMLAFYVASAAFRAFRAKNFEATLLLGTAFLILLGRTAAGVYLTSWLPEELSFLRIEELSVIIMKVFNTAGNRAIMIGIALGIVSTSLKVLLGIDRSYLGSGED